MADTHKMSSGQGGARETDLPPWYWPGIARDEAEKKLTGLPDGSFLVRDCSVAGDFTLTVRSQGACRCVRVYHLHGRYGLAETDTPFSSLADLVQFYRTHSLASFNKGLDVCLKGGVTRSNEVEEVSHYGVFKELYDLSQEQLKAQTRLTILQNQHAELEKNVATCRMMIPALEVVKQMYFDQMKIQTSVDSSVVGDKECEPKSTIRQVLGTLHGVPDASDFVENSGQNGESEETEKQCVRSLSQEEEKSLAINTRLVAKRHSGLVTKLQNMQTHLDTNTANLQDLLHELKSVEVCLLYMQRRRKELTRQMMLMGTDSEYLNQVLEMQVATAEFDRSMWLVDFDREEAVAQLSGLPHGAFLVRRKDRRRFPYVLSILVASTSGGPATVQHCYIVRPQGRGYGFNATLAVFQSVEQLILRHRYVSLKHYFHEIDAPLAFPVGCQEMLNRRSGSMENLLDIGVFDGNSSNRADESAGSVGTIPADNVLEESLRKSETLGNDETPEDAAVPGNNESGNLLQPEEWDTHPPGGSNDIIFTLSDISQIFGTGDVLQRNQDTSASVIKTTETLGPDGDVNEVIYMNIDNLFNSKDQRAERIMTSEMETLDDDDESGGVYENVLGLTKGSNTVTNACKSSNTVHAESPTNTVTCAVKTDDNVFNEICTKSEAATTVTVSSPVLTKSTISGTADVSSPSITSTDTAHTHELSTELSVANAQGVSTTTDLKPSAAHLPPCDKENLHVAVKEAEETNTELNAFCLSTVTEGKNKCSEHKTQMHTEQMSNVQNLGAEEHRGDALTPLRVQPLLFTVPVDEDTRKLNNCNNEGKDGSGVVKETHGAIDTASLSTDGEEENSDTGSDENYAKPHVSQLVNFFEKVKNTTVNTKECDSYVKVTFTGDVHTKARTLDVKSVSAGQETSINAEWAKRKAKTLDFELTGKRQSPSVAVIDDGQSHPTVNAFTHTLNSTSDCMQKEDNANSAGNYPDTEQEPRVKVGSVNPVVEGSTEHVSKGSVKPVAKPFLKPVAKGSIKPVEEGSLEQLANPCLKPVARDNTKPVSEGSVKPAEDSVAQSGGSMKPVAEGSVAPVAEGSVKPVAEGSVKQVAEGSIKPLPEGSLKPVEKYKLKPVSQDGMKPAVPEGSIEPAANSSIFSEGVREDENYNTLPAKTAAEFYKNITKTPLTRAEDVVCTDICHARSLTESGEGSVTSLISRVKEKLAKNSSVNTTKASDNDRQKGNKDRLSERTFEAHVAGATCPSKVLSLSQSLSHNSNKLERNSKEGLTNGKESPDTTIKKAEDNTDKSEKTQQRDTKTASPNTNAKEVEASVGDTNTHQHNTNTTSQKASVKENKDNTPNIPEGRQQHSTKSSVGADAELHAAGLVTYRKEESLHTGVRSLSCSDADFVPDILVSTTIMKSLQVSDHAGVATMAPIFVKPQEDDSDYVDV